MIDEKCIDEILSDCISGLNERIDNNCVDRVDFHWDIIYWILLSSDNLLLTFAMISVNNSVWLIWFDWFKLVFW